MSDYGRLRWEGSPAWVRLAGGEAVLLSAPPWECPEPAAGAPGLDPAAADWLPPVAPSKIVAFARTYPAHAAEMGAPAPARPLMFLKAPSSLLAPSLPVLLPPESDRVECEGELAFVLARRVRRFPSAGDPAPLIAGWLTADDVTARDLQRADGQWARGKGFDTFCPLARTFRSEAPPEDAILTTELNGETVQRAALSARSFSVAELLAWASSAMSLEPGDLVLTGTPEGVHPLAAGDLVTVRIEGVPTLEHAVAAEAR